MNSAIFLDRDGTINRLAAPHEYVTETGQLRFLDGALDALAFLAQNSERRIVIVTNQACIGRGLVTAQQVDDLHEWMVERIEGAGGRIDAVYVCPHRPEDNCRCRKPKTGLLCQAAKDLGLDLRESVIVGDTNSDMLCGYSAGLRECYRVMTGKPLGDAPHHTRYSIYTTLSDVALAIVRREEHERD